MQQVGFTRMADGTKEDYELIGKYEQEYMEGLADRLLVALHKLEGHTLGMEVSRYQHSLQCATRVFRGGESEEMVVAALLHDVGDDLAPYTHGEMVAAILKPFVSERTHWIISHHPVFQSYYYAHHTGGDRSTRDRYRIHPHYQACVDFCELYDQNSFDPDCDSLGIEFFEPMIRRVFAEQAYLDRAEPFVHGRS